MNFTLLMLHCLFVLSDRALSVSLILDFIFFYTEQSLCYAIVTGPQGGHSEKKKTYLQVYGFV